MRKLYHFSNFNARLNIISYKNCKKYFFKDVKYSIFISFFINDKIVVSVACVMIKQERVASQKIFEF